MITRIERERIVPRFISRSHALWWFSRWYYPSDHWVATSRRHRRKHPVCQRCRIRKSTETHHKTYERLWEELESDLLAVCKGCHKALEREKRKKRAVKARKRR